jgi:hypothetical protein
MKSFVQFFYEAFSDLGRLSPEQLRKGYRLNPSDQDNFKQVEGRVFHNVLNAIMKNDFTRGEKSKKLKENLTLYSVKDYLQMKCFLGKNNSSGFCIKDGDELVSVFSSLDSSGNAAVKKAIEEGAKRLDCFATQDENGNILNDGLYKLYSRHGFKIDTALNIGQPNEPYSIQNGISYFVDDDGNVDPTNSTVVIFMKL